MGPRSAMGVTRFLTGLGALPGICRLVSGRGHAPTGRADVTCGAVAPPSPHCGTSKAFEIVTSGIFPVAEKVRRALRPAALGR